MSRVDIGPLTLESGERLDNVRQEVTRYGDPALPAVLVAHALTGSSRIAQWWSGLVGPGRSLDPQRYHIVGINVLGSCYGSSGPTNTPGFPAVTVRDIVAAQARALDVLGIERLAMAIGGSLGGMQALQWALDFPQRIERAVVIGAHDHQSAMAIALNAVQREAISLDPRRGLRLARKIATISYKSEQIFRDRHDRRADRNGRFRFDVEGYLEHQAEQFATRMDARSYVALTHAMDSFDVRNASAGPSPPSVQFVGISSDRLFPADDIRAAAARFAARGFNATYHEIVSQHGHDAFLAQPELLAAVLRPPFPSTPCLS